MRSAILPRLAGRRFASSSTETAKQTAQAAQDKAKSAASSAAATASRYASQASTAGQELLNKAGERVTNSLGSYGQPLAYNWAVAREVAKQVYIKEGLAPPTSLSEFGQVYQQLWVKARDVSWWRSIAENGQWLKVAIYAVEAYGIFTIGEMIGRRHIVGYKLNGPKLPAEH